jgi:hypothetical protein
MVSRHIFRMSVILLFVLALAVVPSERAVAQSAPAARSAAASAPERAASEKALRETVQSFYAFLQAGQRSRAEQFVEEASRERFRNDAGGPFLGFEIVSFEIAPDGARADVNTKLTVFSRFANGPLPVTVKSQWVRRGDGWFATLPETGMADLQALFSSGGASRPPAREVLKFAGTRYNYAVMRNNQVKTARFPFTNSSDQTVTIAEVLTGCKCLVPKLAKKEFKPGESGEIAVDFDPSGFDREYEQTIVVKVQPGDVRQHLVVRATVVPPGSDKPVIVQSGEDQPRITREPASAPPH